jgi:hypothetical protein
MLVNQKGEFMRWGGRGTRDHLRPKGTPLEDPKPKATWFTGLPSVKTLKHAARIDVTKSLSPKRLV